MLTNNRQIAIDSAVFPEGTSGTQLDVLARKALWREGYNYLVRSFIHSFYLQTVQALMFFDFNYPAAWHWAWPWLVLERP